MYPARRCPLEDGTLSKSDPGRERRGAVHVHMHVIHVRRIDAAHITSSGGGSRAKGYSHLLLDMLTARAAREPGFEWAVRREPSLERGACGENNCDNLVDDEAKLISVSLLLPSACSPSHPRLSSTCERCGEGEVDICSRQ